MATMTPEARRRPSPRQNSVQAVTHQRDRLSYLWLVIALVIMPFATSSRWSIFLAAWLYPIFALRFVRTQPWWRGALLLFAGTVLIMFVVLQGMTELPGVYYVLGIVDVGLTATLPFLIDRALAPRLGGLIGTFVFPLAATTILYLHTFDPLMGSSMGNPAYTQYGNLPLLQLLSVTGLWGIDLLIFWLAALVNWVWERGVTWPRVRPTLVVYAGLLALILVAGSLRLAFFPAQATTVRVAGVSPASATQSAITNQLAQQISQQTWSTMLSSTATPAERAGARATLAAVFGPAYRAANAELFSLSAHEARAGAKIIVWPEGGAGVLQEDEAAFLARASVLARSTGAYLDMGMLVLLQRTGPSHVFLDQIALINPAGAIVWRYEKIHPVPGTESATTVAGPNHVPTVQTPYGLVSNVVCFDAAYQNTLRQAGQAGTDIMLVPGNDWRLTDPIDTQVAVFRAIENGYSLVRQASNGLSMTTDYQGNVLAATDYYTTNQQVMVAYVPTQGVRTIYAASGDLFAWLSLLGLLALVGVAIARRGEAGKTGLAAPPSSAEIPPQYPPIEAETISPRN